MTQSVRFLILSGLMALFSLLTASTAEAGKIISIPDVIVDHDTIDFGTVMIGSSRLDSFIVANTGDTSVQIESLAIEDDPDGQFRLHESTGPATLAPQRFIRYHIDFRPVDSGCVDAHLVIASSAGRDTIALHGCALPLALLWNETLSFGLVRIDSCRRMAFTVTNRAGTLRIFRVVPDTLHPFLSKTVIPDAGIEIAAGASFSLEFTFCPDGFGGAARSFRLITDIGWVDIVVEGEGAASVLDVDPDTLSFGTVAVGVPKERSVRFTNNGRLPLEVTGEMFRTSRFAPAATEPAAFTLDAGEWRDMVLRFTPDTIGTLEDTGSITSNSYGGDSFIVLQGRGGAPILDVEPDTIDFGTRVPGSVAVRSARFTNRGEFPLVVDRQMFHTSVFTLAPDVPASFTLGPGEGRDVMLWFLPDTTGVFSDGDTIISNSFGGESFITLRGSAFARHFWWDTVMADVGKAAVMLLHVDPPIQSSDSITGFTGTVTFDPSTVRPHRFFPGPTLAVGSLVWQRSDDSTMTVSYSNGEIVGDTLLGFEFDGLSTGQPLSIVQGEITLDTLRPSAIDTGLIYLNGCEVGLIRNFSRRAQVQALERDPSGDGVVLRFTAPVGAAGAVRVVDLMGEERYRGEIGEIMQEEGSYRIPMAELSTGAYLILLRIADDTSVVRVQWSR